jgi:hypothetical protein
MMRIVTNPGFRPRLALTSGPSSWCRRTALGRMAEGIIEDRHTRNAEVNSERAKRSNRRNKKTKMRRQAMHDLW